VLDAVEEMKAAKEEAQEEANSEPWSILPPLVVVMMSCRIVQSFARHVRQKSGASTKKTQ